MNNNVGFQFNPLNVIANLYKLSILKKNVNVTQALRQKIKNFNLGLLRKTRVTASSGLILIMSFAREIGLIDELEKRFSHLKKRKRGYSVSEKILSFIEMLIKGGRRLNDIDILSSDPGLLDILRMDKFPRANPIGALARGFSRRDIHKLADIVMKLSSNIIRLKRLKEVVIDIDSSLIPSEVEIAEKTYEGFRGFNPLLGIIKGRELNLAGFSLFPLFTAYFVSNLTDFI